MHDKLNVIYICSININGLSDIKLSYLKDKSEYIKAEIICIQETHANNPKIIEQISDILPNYKALIDLMPDATKGTVILVKKESTFTTFEITSKIHRRAMLLELTDLSGFKLEILNVYSPNTTREQADFVETLCELQWETDNRIIIGDFNYQAETIYSSENKRRQNIWSKLFELNRVAEINGSDCFSF